MLHFLSIVLLLSSVSAHVTLDRQCWHEYPFQTFSIQSSQERQKELAQVLQVPFLSQLSEHAPWSYPPLCTQVLPSINDKLCIYTSTSFASGRGISIITTPTLAQRFSSLSAFTDPSTRNTNTPTHAYHTTAIPGKGIGMLASQPLVFGDLITSHTPAFIAYLEDELGTMQREKLWRQAIEQLPGKMKEEFLGLSYVYGDARVRVQDIVKANTFQLEVGGANHLAVWPETSRANHACNPK
jgi:hypothetical protein